MVKCLANKDYNIIKFGGSNFGELKSICIEGAMKLVKIGEKIWRIAVIFQSVLPPMLLLYGIARRSVAT